MHHLSNEYTVNIVEPYVVARTFKRGFHLHEVFISGGSTVHSDKPEGRVGITFSYLEKRRWPLNAVIEQQSSYILEIFLLIN